MNAWLAAVDGLRHLIRVNPGDNANARLRYREALRRDPDYVSALRGLAWTHLLDALNGWSASPADSVSRASELVEAALLKAPDDGMAHSLRGALLLLAGRYDRAVAEGERAVEVLPNSADALAILAHTLTYVGENARAIDLLRRAMRLSPRHPDWYRWSLGRALRLDGQVEEAVRELEKGSGEGSEPIAIHLVELALAYAAAGRLDDARGTARLILAVRPRFSTAKWLSHPAMQDPKAQKTEFELLIASGLPE